MKLKTLSAVSFITLASLTGARAITISYDLTADWSDAANPNGVWAYRQGASPLPSVANWTPGFFSQPQPAWAPSTTPGNFLPTWMRMTTTANSEMQLGDVIVHTTDFANGAASGLANVTWTSPIAGTADLSGAVWMGRDIGRSNHWRLTVNGATVTEGDIGSGDVYSRALPFDFATGTGGAGALAGISVSPGTVIALQFEKTSTFGDFVGVRLHVEAGQASAVPEAGSTAAMLGFAMASLALIRRKLN